MDCSTLDYRLCFRGTMEERSYNSLLREARIHYGGKRRMFLDPPDMWRQPEPSVKEFLKEISGVKLPRIPGPFKARGLQPHPVPQRKPEKNLTALRVLAAEYLFADKPELKPQPPPKRHRKDTFLKESPDVRSPGMFGPSQARGLRPQPVPQMKPGENFIITQGFRREKPRLQLQPLLKKRQPEDTFLKESPDVRSPGMFGPSQARGLRPQPVPQMKPGENFIITQELRREKPRLQPRPPPKRQPEDTFLKETPDVTSPHVFGPSQARGLRPHPLLQMKPVENFNLGRELRDPKLQPQPPPKRQPEDTFLKERPDVTSPRIFGTSQARELRPHPVPQKSLEENFSLSLFLRDDEPRLQPSSKEDPDVRSPLACGPIHMSYKETMEAAAMAWREENDEREITKAENEENLLLLMTLLKNEFSAELEAFEISKAKKQQIDDDTVLLKKVIAAKNRISNQEDVEQRKKIQQLKIEASWKMISQRLQEAISEINDDIRRKWLYENTKQKATAIERALFNVLDFFETQEPIEFQRAMKLGFRKFELQKRQEEIDLMRQKRDEWHQYRRQKRLEIALAPPFFPTGRKLVPRSRPLRAVKKAAEPVE